MVLSRCNTRIRLPTCHTGLHMLAHVLHILYLLVMMGHCVCACVCVGGGGMRVRMFWRDCGWGCATTWGSPPLAPVACHLPPACPPERSDFRAPYNKRDSHEKRVHQTGEIMWKERIVQRDDESPGKREPYRKTEARLSIYYVYMVWNSNVLLCIYEIYIYIYIYHMYILRA